MRDNTDIYLSILSQIKDVFYRTDKEGRLIMASDSCVRILNYDSIDELIGLPLDTWCCTQQDRDMFWQAVNQYGSLEDFEVKLRKKDGGHIYVTGSCHKYYDDAGNMLGYEGVWRDITERKGAELVIQESESKYRSIFEASDSPGFVLDKLTGQVLDANNAACREYGYSREEMLRLRHVDISAEPDKTLQAVAEEDRQTSLRYHKRSNGEVFPVEIINSFCNWNEQRVVLSSVRNITERLASEKALRESEARYRGIVESQRDVVIRFDLEGRPRYASDSWFRITGVPIRTPGVDVRREAVHADDHSKLDKHTARLLHPPYRDYVEIRLKTDTGWRWFGFESYILRDANGNPLEGQTVGRDIHDKKVAEEMLQAHARRLSLATEAAREGVWEHHLPTRSVYLSPQVYALLGYSPEEGESVSPDKTVHPDDFEIVGEHVREHLSGALDRIDCEYRVITKSGDIRWVQCRGRMIEQDEDGVPVLIGGTVTDITEAWESREALKQAHTNLQKAYCVQREFLSCVTHEIRTPLIAVKGYADMLLEGFAGEINEKQRSHLRKIQTSSDALLNGMTGMLEMSRIKSGNVGLSYEIFAPVRLVSRVVSTMMPHAHQKGISLEVHDLGCPCAGVTDSTKFTVILNNLLSNAIKFTDSGEIKLFVESNDNGFSVAVVDTGKGMADENLVSIFEEFEQIKTSTKYKENGFGIGLALVAALVDIIGAELTVSTVQGLGSAFTLYVPKLDISAA